MISYKTLEFVRIRFNSKIVKYILGNGHAYQVVCTSVILCTRYDMHIISEYDREYHINRYDKSMLLQIKILFKKVNDEISEI